jgi:diacylglycerol kinase (ATP)
MAAARRVIIGWRQGTEDYNPFMKASQGSKSSILPEAIRRLGPATHVSLKGLAYAWRTEASFRHEAVLLVVGIAIALWLDAPWAARAALIASLLLVLAVELINSAIEAIVDLVSPGHHELAGRAKDLGSAAVLVAVVLAGGTWLAVLGWLFMS